MSKANPLAALPIQIIIEHSAKASQNLTTVYSGLIKGSGGGVLRAT
jgi:hypothetical protein